MAFAALGACNTTTSRQCDRTCLLELTDAYVAALAAHDPGDLPFAANVAFVEDVQRIPVGEGLWKSATAGPTGFSIHVPDVQLQTAGWLGMMERDGKPAMVAIRLRLENGRIVEAEHRIAGNLREGSLERLKTPREGFLTAIPPDQRIDHDELMRIGGTYYDAVDENDGTLMPFADDCERRENGIVTASSAPRPAPPAGSGGTGAAGPMPGATASPVARDCKGQLSSNVMAYITTIEDRRVFAADPQTGLAMGFSILRHPMDFEPYPVTNLDGSVTMRTKESFGYEPFDTVAAHVWKIGADARVHEIEAMGFRAPSRTPTGWENP